MALESFSLDKSMGAKYHWGVANLDPMRMVGKIYVGALGIATYKMNKPWASWCQRRFFNFFPILSLWKLLILGTGPV